MKSTEASKPVSISTFGRIGREQRRCVAADALCELSFIASVVNTSARKGLTLRPLGRGVSKKCLRGSVELCQKLRLMAL